MPVSNPPVNVLGASIDSSEITNDSIVNADINSAAALAFSKLAALTDGNLLVGSAGNVPTSVTLSGDLTVINSGAATLADGAAAPIKKASLLHLPFALSETTGTMEFSGDYVIGTVSTATSESVKITSTMRHLYQDIEFKYQRDTTRATYHYDLVGWALGETAMVRGTDCVALYENNTVCSAVTDSSSSTTTTDIAAYVSVGSEYLIKITWASGHAYWYVDGTERCHNTSNVPSVPCYFVFKVETSTATGPGTGHSVKIKNVELL